MNESQYTQFEKDRDTWLANLNAVILLSADGSGVPQSGLPLLVEYARQRVEENGGRSSVSIFEVSLKQLLGCNPPELVVLKADPTEESEPEIHELTVQEYRSMPVRQIQLKYRRDPVFKAQVERLIADGLI